MLRGDLQAAEARLAELDQVVPQDEPAPVDIGMVVRRYQQRMLVLRDSLDSDREQARVLMRDLLGPLTLRRRGDEVWAEPQSKEPARVSGTGSSPLIVVAGAGFEPATFGL